MTLQLVSEPTPGPCSSHAYLLIDSLQDGPCLIASASGEFHCLKAVGGADIYQLCTGQSWGIYWYPGANLHHASIYTQEIHKQISWSLNLYLAQLITAQYKPHSLRPYVLCHIAAILSDPLGNSKFHAQFISLLALLSLSRPGPGLEHSGFTKFCPFLYMKALTDRIALNRFYFWLCELVKLDSNSGCDIKSDNWDV